MSESPTAKALQDSKAQPAAESVEPKPLSNKEIKELKKKEKAAKRAAQKLANGISLEEQQKSSMQKQEKKKQIATNTNLKKQLNQTLIKDPNSYKKIPALFSHLETREQRNASSPSISHIVHPAILSLALSYSTYKTVGSVARLRKMLEAFKSVINDYETPPNTTLSRHLTGHLSHQIEYLKTARPLSISMGNAIRILKQEISQVSIDMSDTKAKELLIEKIDEFINEKINLSDRLIIESASKHISTGSTVLTFGSSEVLEGLFKHCALSQNKKFSLKIVDSRPLFEGKKLLHSLAHTFTTDDKDSTSGLMRISPEPITKSHIDVQYVLINSLSSTILEDVDCVFLGAHAMLSNGHLFSRVGTALIAMMSNSRNIPVIVCCESIKFSDKVQLDSVTTNELADSEDLLQDIDSQRPPQKKSFALEQFIHQTELLKKVDTKSKSSSSQKKAQVNDQEDLITNWKENENLSILNIMYDLTPPHYIKKVVTEFGALPPSSVPVILREYKST